MVEAHTFLAGWTQWQTVTHLYFALTFTPQAFALIVQVNTLMYSKMQQHVCNYASEYTPTK